MNDSHLVSSSSEDIDGCIYEYRYHDIVLGLYSLSGRMSYRKISRSLEAARFGFELFLSL